MNVLQTVDAKKLEKAEAKLKAKHVRRNDKDGQKTSTPMYVPRTLSLRSMSVAPRFISRLKTLKT